MSESLTKALLNEYLDKALDDKTVQQLLKEAMKVTDEKNREYGGYIFRRGDGVSLVKRFGGETGSISLHGSREAEKIKSDIIEKEKGVIVADYHCHPGTKKFECVPSQEDIDNAKSLTCRRLVITHTTPMMAKVGSRLHAKQPLPKLFLWDVDTAVSQ